MLLSIIQKNLIINKKLDSKFKVGYFGHLYKGKELN